MYGTEDLTAETLAALIDASAAINSANDLEATLTAIAAAAASVMNAEASSVIMLDKARGKQVFRAAFGQRAERLIGIEYDQAAGISGQVLQTGLPTIVNDVTSDSTHYKDIDALVDFHTHSLLAAPLIHKGSALGVVEVINSKASRRFNEYDRLLGQVFANLAAIAAANSQFREQLRRDNRGLKDSLSPHGQIVGQSPAVQEVKDLIARVAQSDATVLLLGETGTGKELAAHLVHTSSKRSARPFIAVNCAALPRELLESELFGHEAGAFTGATGRKLGRFELADGGTIFLDEVAEITPDIQAKLLRVLQEKEIVRIGGVAPVGCNARVIAATNRDLAEAMRAGRFREDLYFRLNVFPIYMPPLREHKEDLPMLVEQFLKRIADEMKIPQPTISPEALTAMSRYDFPGNVRELHNILERACVLSRSPGTDEPGCLTPQYLPHDLVGQSEQAPAGSALAAGEKAMITAALAANNWNQSRAARSLGISRDNIRYRIKKYGLKRPD